MVKNKKGWIKIVEAFVAIMIIMAVLLIVINKEYVNNDDVFEKIYEVETSILYAIVSDDITKKSVIEFSLNPSDPLEIPKDVNAKRIEATPDYLDCILRICAINDLCEALGTEGVSGKNIYAQSINARSSDDPTIGKQLKIFCWVK